MKGKLKLCASLFAALAVLGASGAKAEGYKAGAIRWDAWYGGDKSDPQDPGHAVERALQDEQWRYRTPVFMTRNPDGTITLNGAKQEIVDSEIELAHAAGLKFWAYCLYGDDSAMSRTLDLHRKSAKKKLMPFCVIMDCRFADKIAPRLLELIRDEAYFKIDGRPVIFSLATLHPFIKTAFDSQKWGERKEALFAKIEKLCGKKPFYVIMESDPDKRAAQFIEYFKPDALSAYWAVKFNKEAADYEVLMDYNREFWKRNLALGIEYIPVVTAGADRRPRIFEPMPWEKQKKGHNAEFYYKPASPAQVAKLLTDALKFIDNNPTACPHKLAIIYAWNEYDEGGWIAPVMGDGDARLKAIGGVLKEAEAR